MLTVKIEEKAFGKIIVAFILFLLIHHPVAFSQRLNFEFDPLNALPDITSRQTTAILEDSLGFLWVGTEEGLFRYDGQTVYPYLKEKESSKTLPSNHINTLLLDRDNNLWIVTSSGICRYNYEYDNFISPVDKSEINGFAKCNIKELAFDNNGELFVVYKQSIYKYNKKESLYSKVIELEVGIINSIVFDSKNNLWIGASRNGGLFCYDLNKKTMISYLHNPKDRNSLSVNEVKTLAISDKTLWIGTSGNGIDVFDLEKETFTNHSFPN